MIEFNYENDFTLKNEEITNKWIQKCLEDAGFITGDINYIFCNDEYLHKINVEYLNHDTLTDIISFDYTENKIVSGDIFISTERVEENSTELKTDLNEELHRVIIHGILHYMGYKDKTQEDKKEMRAKEDECLDKR